MCIQRKWKKKINTKGERRWVFADRNYSPTTPITAASAVAMENTGA